MIDLHIHTLASQDGQYSPREVFDLVRAHGLRAIAFADHDSVASVPEGIKLAREFAIEFVPAVELTTTWDGHEMHLLAYYIDPSLAELLEVMDGIASARLVQAEQRVKRLQDLGYAIDYLRVLYFSQGKPPTGFPIFQAIIENPVNHRLPSFQRYLTGDRSASPLYNFAQDHLTKGKPAYVPVKMIDTPHAIAMVRRWNAVPVLAHPGRTPLALVDDFIDAGLVGVEAFNPSHTPEQTQQCLELARRRNLLVTAGSDFHGPAIKPDIRLAELEGAGYHLYEALKAKAAAIKGAR